MSSAPQEMAGSMLRNRKSATFRLSAELKARHIDQGSIRTYPADSDVVIYYQAVRKKGRPPQAQLFIKCVGEDDQFATRIDDMLCVSAHEVVVPTGVDPAAQNGVLDPNVREVLRKSQQSLGEVFNSSDADPDNIWAKHWAREDEESHAIILKDVLGLKENRSFQLLADLKFPDYVKNEWIKFPVGAIINIYCLGAGHFAIMERTGEKKSLEIHDENFEITAREFIPMDTAVAAEDRMAEVDRFTKTLGGTRSDYLFAMGSFFPRVLQDPTFMDEVQKVVAGADLYAE